MAPIAAGLGPCMIMASVYSATYYNVIIAWSIHYMFNTFRNPLKWSHCTNDFNSHKCFDDIRAEECVEGSTTYYRGYCLSTDDLVGRMTEIDENWQAAVAGKFPNQITAEEYRQNFADDTSDLIAAGDNVSIAMVIQRKVGEMYNMTGRLSPPMEYFVSTLDVGAGIEPKDYGTPKWDIVLCLLAAWVLVFFCLLGGTKTSGKVVYFTATFPYVILIILLGRGLSLGAGVGDGIRFFLVPNTTHLAQPEVWGDAAKQIFFSLSLAYGGLTTIASYNKFHNNLFRDTLIVVLGNCGTSFFAGFVIFPVVGFIANGLGKTVEEVAGSGPTLAFMTYPHAINRMAVPQLWAFLFFFMLILLGIDSQMVVVETPVTALCDWFSSLRTPRKKAMAVAVFSVCAFLFGLVFTCPGSVYLITLFDGYASGWPIVIGGCLELVVVMWIYGVRRFIADVRLMLGEPPNKFYRVLGYPVNPYWIANWVVITPALLFAILVFNIIKFKRTTDGSYLFPIEYDVVGWLITISCLISVPAFAIYEIIKCRKEGRSWMTLFKPTKDWGPGDPRAAVRSAKLGRGRDVAVYPGEQQDDEQESTRF